jgi:putative membrane protein
MHSNNRKLKDYLVILTKGIGMGAADVIPGVSGGTIAFITGIYEELIHSIKSIDIGALQLFFKGKWASFWKHINGNFLLSVFAGIFIAVVSLARLLEHLLETQPVLIWSFFFGLILVSSYVVARRIKVWNYGKVVALVTGIGAAFYITSVTPAETTDAAWFIVLSGMLASCAMILPGISGSFILLLLGKYAFALNAVNEVEIGPILMLGAGAVIGLLSLSRLLSWLFTKYHDVTVAVLAGFMIGSLNKIWPWKETVETVVIDGVTKPLVEKNVLPAAGNPTDQLFPAILMMIAGVALILLFELLFKKKESV